MKWLPLILRIVAGSTNIIVQEVRSVMRVNLVKTKTASITVIMAALREASASMKSIRAKVLVLVVIVYVNCLRGFVNLLDLLNS